MVDQDFAAEIDRRRKALDSNVERLEGVRQEFVAAVAEFARTWWSDQAKKVVEQEHEVTDKLSDGQLGELKAEVQSLVRNAHPEVDACLSSANTWWHLKAELVEPKTSDNPLSYQIYGERHRPQQLEKAVRSALGLLGPVMEKYGYLRRYPWGENRKPYYRFDFAWPKELSRLSKAYAVIHEDSERLVVEILRIQETQKRTRSKSRWDSV